MAFLNDDHEDTASLARDNLVVAILTRKVDDLKHRLYVPMRLAASKKMSRFAFDTFIMDLNRVANVRQAYHLGQLRSMTIDSEY